MNENIDYFKIPNKEKMEMVKMSTNHYIYSMHSNTHEAAAFFNVTVIKIILKLVDHNFWNSRCGFYEV